MFLETGRTGPWTVSRKNKFSAFEVAVKMKTQKRFKKKNGSRFLIGVAFLNVSFAHIRHQPGISQRWLTS